MAGSVERFSGGYYKIIVASRYFKNSISCAFLESVHFTSSDGKAITVLLCYVELRDELLHLDGDPRLQRFSVLKVKASELRLKVLGNNFFK